VGPITQHTWSPPSVCQGTNAPTRSMTTEVPHLVCCIATSALNSHRHLMAWMGPTAIIRVLSL